MGKFRDVINALMGPETTPQQKEVVTTKAAGSYPLSAIRNGKFETWNIGGNNVEPFSNNYVIYRGISLLAQNIAALPLQIFRGKELMDPDFVLPGLDLQNPNAEMSLYELLYQSCIYYFYRGEFMVYINIEGGSYSLEPVNPRLMKRMPEGYWRWNNKKNIPDEQIIFCKLLNPDGFRGLSPVDVVSAELNIDMQAVDFNTAMLENYGQLGGVITFPENGPNRDDAAEIAKNFKSNHGGAKKAGEILVLGDGMNYAETAKTMAEMQFLEGRKDVRDRILGILGIHKAIFGVTDSVDRAVAESARRMLWQDTLQPNAIRIAEKFNVTLMKQFYPEYRVYFNFDNVEALKEDMTERLERALNYRRLSYTVNEINNLLDLGMDEIDEDGMNIRVIESTYSLVDDLLLEPEPVPPQLPNAPGNAPESAQDDLEPEVEEEKANKVIDSINKIIDSDTMDKASRRYVRNFDKLRKKTEKKFNSKLRGFFSKELGKVLSVLHNSKSIDKISENNLLAEIHGTVLRDKEILMATLIPVYEDGSLGASTLAQGMVDVTTINPRIHEEIVGRLANEIRGVQNYTYKMLRNQVKEGLKAGETVDQIGRRIQDVYKFSASRSKTIARTETLKIVSQSTDKEYKDAGVKKKQWLGGHRDTHVENASQGVVDYNFSYNGGLQYPGDNGPAGEVINCTCALAPVIEGDNDE